MAPDDGDSATAAWRKAVQEARDAEAGVGTGERIDDGWLVVEDADEDAETGFDEAGGHRPTSSRSNWAIVTAGT